MGVRRKRGVAGVNVRRVPVVLRSATVAARQRRALPQTLIFFVTSRCNARCNFCLYKDSVENPTRRSEELTPEEVRRIAANYGPLHLLALSGGEPFVRRDIAEICQAFIDHCSTSVIDIPSNFAYGDNMVEAVQQLASQNPSVVVELQMSIDQLGDLHDESRGVAGLFDTAIANFRRLEAVRTRHPNVSLKVNVVWLERNKDHLDAVLGELEQLVDFDRIAVAYPHERLPASGGHMAQVADFERFRRHAEAAAARSRRRFDPYGVPMRATKVASHRVLHDALTGREAMGDVCGAGRNIVVLDEKGDVFPCETIWESVGNVRAHDLDVGKVLAGREYGAFRTQHLGSGSCNCTWSCAALSAVSMRPSGYPRLAGDAVRVALGRSGAT